MVRAATNIKPPFYHAELSGRLELGLGSAYFEHMPQDAAILQYDDEAILRVGYVADETFGGSRPSISGSVFDIEANEIVHFEDNWINLHATDVDVVFEGRELRIRDRAGTPILRITFSPPNGIEFNCLRMRFGDLILEMDETFGVTFPTASGAHHKCLVSGIRTQGARSAISYSSDQTRWSSSSNLELIGGRGILIPQSGVTIAAGAGMMLVPRLEYCV